MVAKTRNLTLLSGQYAVCQLPAGSEIPVWAMPKQADFFAVTQTKEELSIICPQQAVPEGQDVVADKGWSCLKLEGPFELDEPGVMASIASPLGKAGISVFAEATYNTDYFLVNDIDLAVKVLIEEGHIVSNP